VTVCVIVHMCVNTFHKELLSYLSVEFVYVHMSFRVVGRRHVRPRCLGLIRAATEWAIENTLAVEAVI